MLTIEDRPGPVDKFSQLEVVRSDLNEAEVAVSAFVISRGQSPETLQLVETTLNAITHRSNVAIYVDVTLPFSRMGMTVAVGFHLRPDFVRVIASVCHDNLLRRTAGRHYDVEPDTFRRLATSQLGQIGNP